MKRDCTFAAAIAVCALLFFEPAWSQVPGPPPPPARTQPLPAPGPPRMGSVNYLEGQVSVNGMPLAPNSIGYVALNRDQVLTTQAGKAEVLLTPGVFLRVADNSSVKMVSPDLANTRVQLDKGRAFIEVLDIRSQNDIRMDQNGGSIKLLNKGLYDFDADHAMVRVFKGKAELTVGGQKVNVSEGHQVMVAATGKLKAQGFDTKAAQDDFYRWNSLRSGYLSEASVSAARAYMGPGPGLYAPGWTGFGWYWDPWFGVFTFLPPGDIFYSPFGFAFFSPFGVYRSPYFYHPGIPHGFGEFHYPYGHGVMGPGRFGEPRR